MSSWRALRVQTYTSPSTSSAQLGIQIHAFTGIPGHQKPNGEEPTTAAMGVRVDSPSSPALSTTIGIGTYRRTSSRFPHRAVGTTQEPSGSRLPISWTHEPRSIHVRLGL